MISPEALGAHDALETLNDLDGIPAEIARTLLADLERPDEGLVNALGLAETARTFGMDPSSTRDDLLPELQRYNEGFRRVLWSIVMDAEVLS